MASFNKIVIVGYLGRDPEIKYLPDGTGVCNFSVATTEKRKVHGEMQETTTWFRITVWGRQAEAANQYLSKGRQVYIEGRLKMEEYTGRDGNPRSSLVVNASDVQFLGSAGDGERSGRATSSQSRRETRDDSNDGQLDGDGVYEDEVPF